MFKALLTERAEDGTTTTAVQELPDERLPAGDVTVEVEYTTIKGLSPWLRSPKM